MTQCCHCAYKSSAQGVRTHIAIQHRALSPPKVFGRPKGPACALCKWIHVDLLESPRQGPVYGRKRFEHGKIAAVLGTIPRGGRMVKFGELTVPKGVTRLDKISFSFAFCTGPFSGAPDAQGRRYCLSCRRRHNRMRRVGSHRNGPMPLNSGFSSLRIIEEERTA